MSDNKPLSDNHQKFAETYCGNGHNASEAYKTAYPNCKSGWNAHGARLIAKDSISKEIARIIAKKEVKLDITRVLQYKRLTDLYDMAIEQRNPVAARGVLNEMNNMLGYLRDKAPKAEREAEARSRLSAEELAYKASWEAERCKDEAKTVKIKKQA